MSDAKCRNYTRLLCVKLIANSPVCVLTLIDNIFAQGFSIWELRIVLDIIVWSFSRGPRDAWESDSEFDAFIPIYGQSRYREYLRGKKKIIVIYRLRTVLSRRRERLFGRCKHAYLYTCRTELRLSIKSRVRANLRIKQKKGREVLYVRYVSRICFA